MAAEKPTANKHLTSTSQGCGVHCGSLITNSSDPFPGDWDLVPLGCSLRVCISNKFIWYFLSSESFGKLCIRELILKLGYML